MEALGENLETMPRVPLADHHVAALHRLGRIMTYAEGEVVVEAGDPMDSFVYVLEGEIEVVDPRSRNRLMESSIGPTQFMGEIAFLNAGANILPMRAPSGRASPDAELRACGSAWPRASEGCSPLR